MSPGTHSNRVPQEELWRGIKVDPHPGTSLWGWDTSPLLKTIPLRIFLNGTFATFFRSNKRRCQSGGGSSFVPLRVLLPFSLEETAAPADRKDERRRGITTMGRKGRETKSRREQPSSSSTQNITTKSLEFSTRLPKSRNCSRKFPFLTHSVLPGIHPPNKKLLSSAEFVHSFYI